MSDASEPVAAAPAEQKLELLPNTFRCHDREWTIRFTDNVIKAVEDIAKVDLWKAIEIKDNPLVKLGRDERLLRDAVWVIVKGQVETAAISKDAFFESFNGQVFDDSHVAIQGGLERFFSAHRRALLRQTIHFLEKMGQSEIASQEESLMSGLAQMREVAREAISKTGPKIKAAMMNAAELQLDDALSQGSKNASTSSNAAATWASSQET